MNENFHSPKTQVSCLKFVLVAYDPLKIIHFYLFELFALILTVLVICLKWHDQAI